MATKDHALMACILIGTKYLARITIANIIFAVGELHYRVQWFSGSELVQGGSLIKII